MTNLEPDKGKAPFGAFLLKGVLYERCRTRLVIPLVPTLSF